MNDFVLHVNGTEHRIHARDDEMLLSVLREKLQLTGTKYGCGEGECGACTVLLNGIAARSCQTAASSASDAQITTIEGLEHDGNLTLIQQAFLDEGAFQCAYCTSGMVLSATALLDKNPHPTEQQIVEAMDGNLCRCGVYPRIVAAIQRAVRHAPRRAQ